MSKPRNIASTYVVLKKDPETETVDVDRILALPGAFVIVTMLFATPWQSTENRAEPRRGE